MDRRRRLSAARPLRARPARRRADVDLHVAGAGLLLPERQQGRRRRSSAPTASSGGFSTSTSSRAAPFTDRRRAQAARSSRSSTRTTRDRLFGGRPAVGQTFEVDGQRFRVVGVVRDVPRLRLVPFADIWVPFTTAKTDAYKTRAAGRLQRASSWRGTARRSPGMQEELQLAARRAPSCRTRSTTPRWWRRSRSMFEALRANARHRVGDAATRSACGCSWSARRCSSCCCRR